MNDFPKEWQKRLQSISRSPPPEGSGKISLDGFRRENECSPLLPWEPTVPESLKLGPSLEGPGTEVMSEELCRQLPKRAAFQEPRDDVVLRRAEVEGSSLTTFSGFSKAFKMYLTSGRLEGLGFRQDLATIAIAHTSSRRSSSTTRDGSRIFVTSSFSLMLM